MSSPAVPTAALGMILTALLALEPPLESRSSVPSSETDTDFLPCPPPQDLSADETALWLRGRELFARTWDEPAGLGAPGFNAASCAHCHNAPGLGGGGASDVNVLGVIGVDSYFPTQADMREIGLAGDVQAQLRCVRDGGPPVTGVAPERIVERQTPSLYGLALIDSIPACEIERNAQRKQMRGDRVYGRVRRLRVGHRQEVGRFGWKAQAARLEDFVCMALGGELGLTAPDQGRGFGLSRDTDGAADPELTQQDFDALLFFVRNLAVPPAALAAEDAQADAAGLERGEQLFEQVRCAACHVPVLMGEYGPVPLYSDLLLHRVLREFKGRGCAAFFRTPPLWGVRDTAPYLHDGRAATLRDAILLHAGEAVRSRQCFEGLAPEDQDALVAFVASLPVTQPAAPRPEPAREAARVAPSSDAGAEAPPARTASDPRSPPVSE
jgi:Di-haem oxidoreductase, putative peroxidase